MSDVLYQRITREHDNRKYKRKPAKGNLIIKLENMINKSCYKVVEFDGYIIPIDGSKVTLLLYCREYNRDLNSLKIEDLANLLFDELKKEVEFALSEKLTNIFDCSLACVFSPYDYPRDEQEAEEKDIIVFPYIEKKKILKKMNIKSFRNFLYDHKKRFTVKPLIFAPTKLEYYLSQLPYGQTKTIAFPGDADGIFMDEHYNILAILEYKSDTYGKNINEERQDKYKEDTTRFNVLDDLCKLLDVPLIIIFWSDTHTKSKIIVRNANNKKEISFIIESENYSYLATEIFDTLNKLDDFVEKIK